MFKWVCLGVAVVALAGFGWMLNDVRLEIKGLAEKTDKHLPTILDRTERLTGQLDRQLPQLLSDSRTAVVTIDHHLPRILESAELSADRLADLSGSFGQYKELMGVVHVASQNKGLFSYGASVLSWIEGQPAKVGLKAPGRDGELKDAKPAKDWAGAARKDTHFLSLIAASKTELLHGLARSNTTSEWHIQIGSQAPRPLAGWLKETHKESQDLKDGAAPASPP